MAGRSLRETPAEKANVPAPNGVLQEMRNQPCGTGRVMLAILAATLAGCPESDQPSSPSGPRAADSPEGSVRCDYPSLRPTYLPWQRSGAIPEPRRSYDSEIDRAQLSWVNPNNPKEGLGLTVYPVIGAGPPEKPIGVRIRGADGYLHEGSVGEHGVWWDLDERCNFLELSLSLDGVSPEKVDEEVVKVARSLEE